MAAAAAAVRCPSPLAVRVNMRATMTPSEVEHLLTRIEHGEDVPSMSLDAVAYTSPLPLPLPLEAATAVPTLRGVPRDYVHVLVRRVITCVEPSLSPVEAAHWHCTVVVRAVARRMGMRIKHHSPDAWEVFEPLLTSLAALRHAQSGGDDHDDDGEDAASPFVPPEQTSGEHPLFFNAQLAWLLLVDCARAPKGDALAAWAASLAHGLGVTKVPEA